MGVVLLVLLKVVYFHDIPLILGIKGILHKTFLRRFFGLVFLIRAQDCIQKWDRLVNALNKVDSTVHKRGHLFLHLYHIIQDFFAVVEHGDLLLEGPKLSYHALHSFEEEEQRGCYCLSDLVGLIF